MSRALDILFNGSVTELSKMNIDKMQVVDYHYPDKDIKHCNHFYRSFVPLLGPNSSTVVSPSPQSVSLEVDTRLAWIAIV